MKKFIGSKKSVSPVIATILLVGVAIGAAALAYSWYIGIQATSQEKGGTQAAEITKGSAASVEVISAKRNSSTTVSVKLKNTGGIDLSNVNVSGWLGNSLIDSDTVASLPAGSTNTATLDANRGAINIVKVSSSDGKFLTSYPFVE